MSLKITGEMAWVDERSIVTQAAVNGVRKGARIEKERIANGWRWVKVGKRTQILIPCDSEGNPTKDGLERIERMKKTLSVY